MQSKEDRLLIAVDGPAASGKGSLARKLADYFGLTHLDTGKIYRYLGYLMLKNGISIAQFSESQNIKQAVDISDKITVDGINKADLSSEQIGQAASVISAIPEIRKALLDFQRKVAESPKGAVLDGRDIGTVVCPDASFKLFITASLEARAKRRYKELQTRGFKVIYGAVLKDLTERDERDKNRKISPLVPAKDAIHIDTTYMDERAVLEKVLSLIIQQNRWNRPEKP